MVEHKVLLHCIILQKCPQAYFSNEPGLKIYKKEHLSVCMSPVVICQMSQSDLSPVSILGQEECSHELYVRRINTFQADEVPMMLLVW